MYRSFGQAIGANFVSLLISTLLLLFVPKLVGVTNYGYWQLYVFYLGWTGLLHLGWIDGIYLKVAGTQYRDLNFRRLNSQFWSCAAWMTALGAVLVLLATTVPMRTEMSFVVSMLGPGVLLVCLNGFLNLVLQSTGRIADYARITLQERATFAGLILLVLGAGAHSFALLITAELVARICTFIYLVAKCSDIVWRRPGYDQVDRLETIDNVRVGSKLLISNAASMGVVGIARLAIQREWGVEVFGKLSLALSVSSLLMVFVSAVGVVVFPMLIRVPVDLLPRLFTSMRIILSYALLSIILIYFPLRLWLLAWLPQYEEGIRYLALLFPLVLFDARMILVVSVFLKVLRKEGLLSLVNLAAVLFAAIWTTLSVFVAHNLTWTVLGISLAVAFRCTLGEALLARTLKLRGYVRSMAWLLVCASFVSMSWFDPSWKTATIYAGLVALTIVIDRKRLRNSLRLALSKG